MIIPTFSQLGLMNQLWVHLHLAKCELHEKTFAEEQFLNFCKHFFHDFFIDFYKISLPLRAYMDDLVSNEKACTLSIKVSYDILKQ